MDNLRMSVPRVSAPVPYAEAVEHGTQRPSLFEVDKAISRVTQELQKLEISDSSLHAARMHGRGAPIPNPLFKDLPDLSEIPPPAMPRAPPTASAAGHEERQTRMQQAHEAARRRAEIDRKFHRDRIINEIKARHHADLLQATPLVLGDAPLPREYSPEDDDVVRGYFG